MRLHIVNCVDVVYEILTPNIYKMSPAIFSIEDILMKHVEYFKYIEKKEIYIENINTLNSANVLCVAQRGQLQHLLR